MDIIGNERNRSHKQARLLHQLMELPVNLAIVLPSPELEIYQRAHSQQLTASLEER